MTGFSEVKYRVRQAAGKVDDPSSYLSGRRGGMPEEPDNILLFRHNLHCDKPVFFLQLCCRDRALGYLELTSIHTLDHSLCCCKQ